MRKLLTKLYCSRLFLSPGWRNLHDSHSKANFGDVICNCYLIQTHQYLLLNSTTQLLFDLLPLHLLFFTT